MILFQVLLQLALFAERLWTCVAAKGLGIDVNKHVIPQICALNTSVLTLLTFKSLVLAMNAPVLV